VKRGDADAMKWLRRDAEQGNPGAQCRLGICYLKGHGDGIRRDQEKAVHWFYKAAVQGHADAQCQLGDWCLRLRSVYKKEGDAVKWFSMAAEQGNKDATQKLSALLQQQEKEAACHKKEAARYKAAQERWTKEIKKFSEAAKKGNVKAQYQLGLIYSGESKIFNAGILSEYRYDIPRHCREEAAKWFLKAAEQGHTEAQRKIAECYFKGRGVLPNPEEAIEWLRKANRLLKRTELVKRLKTLAEGKPSREIDMSIGGWDDGPISHIPMRSEIRNRYVKAVNSIQSYGVDATLIFDGEDVSLEINYPDQPEPIRTMLESIFDLELIKCFLSGADHYKIYRGQGEVYPLRAKIARLAELFGLELPSKAEASETEETTSLWKKITKRLWGK
jgi:TPR repeat protein